jgi:WD40 repeat protein
MSALRVQVVPLIVTGLTRSMVSSSVMRISKSEMGTLRTRDFGHRRCSGNAGRAKHWKLKNALQICVQLCVCASSMMHRELPFGKLHSIRRFQESTKTTRSSTPVKTMVFTPFWDLRTGRTRCECFVTTGRSLVTASSRKLWFSVKRALQWECQRLGIW